MRPPDFQNLADAAALPRLSQPVAQTLNRIYAWPDSLACRVRDFLFHCRWDYGARLSQPTCTYRFQCGPATGWILLEAWAERLLIGDAAHPDVPPDLRYALVADALTPWLDALEKLLRRPMELLPPGDAQPPGSPDDVGWLRFHVTRETVIEPGAEGASAPATEAPEDWHCHGALHFDDDRWLSLACAEREPASRPRHRLGSLPVGLVFRLGTTRLSLREMRGIAHGDIVGIEHWVSAGKSLMCKAVLPGEVGRVITGKIGGNQILIEKIQEVSLNEENSIATAEASDAGDRTLKSLDAMEVEVSFELEKRTMTLAELQALREGHIVELEQPLNQSRVHILANGARVGHGHLIAVGNKLGVRVSEFAGTHHAR